LREFAGTNSRFKFESGLIFFPEVEMLIDPDHIVFTFFSYHECILF